MKHIILIGFSSLAILMAKESVASSISQECSFFEAVYKPFSSSHVIFQDGRRNRLTLHFSEGKSDRPLIRKYYFNFDLLGDSGEVLSTLRLANSCSQGFVVCRANAYWGQYAEEENVVKLDRDFKLDFTLLNQDFSIYRNDKDHAPYAIVFNNTKPSFYYDLQTIDGKNLNGKELPFVEYFSEDKIFPYFGGRDVWIFDQCNLSE